MHTHTHVHIHIHTDKHTQTHTLTHTLTHTHTPNIHTITHHTCIFHSRTHWRALLHRFWFFFPNFYSKTQIDPLSQNFHSFQAVFNYFECSFKFCYLLANYKGASMGFPIISLSGTFGGILVPLFGPVEWVSLTWWKLWFPLEAVSHQFKVHCWMIVDYWFHHHHHRPHHLHHHHHLLRHHQHHLFL